MKVHSDRQSRGIRGDITSITFCILQPPQFHVPELNQGPLLVSVENVRHVEKAFAALGQINRIYCNLEMGVLLL